MSYWWKRPSLIYCIALLRVSNLKHLEILIQNTCEFMHRYVKLSSCSNLGLPSCPLRIWVRWRRLAPWTPWTCWSLQRGHYLLEPRWGYWKMVTKQFTDSPTLQYLRNLHRKMLMAGLPELPGLRSSMTPPKKPSWEWLNLVNLSIQNARGSMQPCYSAKSFTKWMTWNG